MNNLSGAVLKSVRLINFKIHDDFIFNFEELNDIYGKNRVGKSSIVQAIQVCLFPKKSDVSKIKHGKDFCELITTFEADEGEGMKPLVFSTKITSNGNVYKKDTYDNILLKKVAELRSQLVSFGTFNPRELLDKKNRKAYLLKILPLKITKKELLTHLQNINESGKQYEEDSIYELNGFDLLKDFETFIRNIRHSKGLIKEERKKSYEKRQKDYQNEFSDYTKLYGQFLQDLDERKKQVYSSSAVYKEKQSILNDVNKSIESHNQLIKEKQNNIESVNKVIVECNEQIDKIKTKMRELIEEQEQRIKIQKENLIKLQSSINETEKYKKSDEDKRKNVQLEINKISEDATHNASMENRIKFQERLQNQQTTLKTEYSEVEDALKKWGFIDNYIKKEFDQYKIKKITDCLKNIDNLEYRDDQFYWNNSDIDELSESESIELGISIYCVNKEGANYIAIDCAEAMDEKNCEKAGEIAKKHKKKLVLFRVANSPLNKNFNSLEIKKEIDSE